MLAELVTGAPQVREFAELLRRIPHPDGSDPEERMVICGIGWEHYLALDQSLGDDRPGPRLYYLDGELEIMTTSNEHERVKRWIGGFLDDYFLEHEIDVATRGQATMRSELEAAGAEPDESWCIGEEKQWPDLVLEIALTSGGVNKLEIYRRFGVREVWFWRRGGLEIYSLGEAGYARASRSALLTDLDVDLLRRCVAIQSWREARQTFRAGLQRTAQG